MRESSKSNSWTNHAKNNEGKSEVATQPKEMLQYPEEVAVDKFNCLV